MQPAVFLDRDNTMIRNDGHLGDPDQVTLLDGTAESLGRLHQAGLPIIVITNQSGVARGLFSESDVRAVHDRIEELLAEVLGRSDIIRAWYFCPWHPEAVVSDYRGDHEWRKPHPGMLLAAAHDHDLDLEGSWMIGDQERDVLAGHAAGCRTLLLAPAGTPSRADCTREGLPAAVDYLLGKDGA